MLKSRNPKYYFIKRVLILLILPFSTFAQHNNLVIYGRIVNEQNTPVANANIVDNTGSYGCSSDANGIFNLKIDTEIQSLIISHLGYKTQIININTDKYKKDSSYFLIIMKKKSVRLKEVEVVGENTTLAYKNKELWVFDYEITKDGIYILTSKSNFGKKTVLFLSFSGDTIAYGAVNKQFNKFYKDSFDNILLFGNDSVYQLETENEKVNFLYPCMVDNINPVFFSVIGYINSCFIQQEYSNFNQTVSYFYINKNTKKKKTLISVSNKEKAEINRNYYYGQIAKANGLIKTGDISTTEELDYLRKLINDDMYFKLIMTKPVYNPLKIIGNQVVLFDFEDDKIVIYDSAFKLIRTVPVTFHKSEYWDNAIYIDQTNHKCFGRFTKQGIVTLKQIDLTTGKTEGEVVLQHIYPKKIRINDDNVYYLYHEMSEGSRNKQYLYKYIMKR